MTLQDIKLTGHDFLKEQFGDSVTDNQRRTMSLLLTVAYNEGILTARQKAHDAASEVARMILLKMDEAKTEKP